MEDAKELIRKAFAVARESGKQDWRRMTIAVLKNRILSITNREFNEAKYGAATFQEFVRQAGDLVRVDDSVLPAVVELLDEGGVGIAATPPPGTPATGGAAPSARIRPDLWRAVMDYASGQTFVWDATEGRAREARTDETSPHKLPTVSAEELTQWRGEFVRQRIADPVTAEKLETWQKHRLPSTTLPGWLRGVWYEYLKARIESRLRLWFQREGFEAPPDLATSGSASLGTRLAGLEALRQLVSDCVAEMTEKEIAELRLPPAAVLRAQQRRKGSQ